MTNSQNVPMVDVQLQLRRLEDELMDAVRRVIVSGQVILGPEAQALEEEIAAYCGASFGVGCASGTDAVLLPLCALGIGPGDEVILPAFTFFATAGSVCRTGARPVFVDIDEETYNLEPAQVAKSITPRTRAIMPVHLYGQTAEMAPLWQLSQEHSIPIIEDAAQAIGAEYHGKRAGSLGDMACFSFYPSKNLSCCGEGGMVTTSNPQWAETLATLRNQGMNPKYHHQLIGWNARLDAVQAAILRVKLTFLEEWTAARQVVAQRYDEMIDAAGCAGFLQRPVVAAGRRHVYNQYVVRVSDGLRDDLQRHLQRNQIGCEVYYPIPLHLQKCLSFLGYAKGDFPVSEAASRCVLALPMYPELTAQQQERVVDCCADFMQRKSRRAA